MDLRAFSSYKAQIHLSIPFLAVSGRRSLLEGCCFLWKIDNENSVVQSLRSEYSATLFESRVLGLFRSPKDSTDRYNSVLQPDVPNEPYFSTCIKCTFQASGVLSRRDEFCFRTILMWMVWLVSFENISKKSQYTISKGSPFIISSIYSLKVGGA